MGDAAAAARERLRRFHQICRRLGFTNERWQTVNSLDGQDLDLQRMRSTRHIWRLYRAIRNKWRALQSMRR